MNHNLFVKNIESALIDLEAIPLWGSPPPFPWKKFSKELEKTLELSDLEIHHHESQWLSKEELLKAMGESPPIQFFHLSPLPGFFAWIMPKESQSILTSLLLNQTKKNGQFSDPLLQEGFYQYTCLNVLETFNRIHSYGNFTAALAMNEELPEEGALCIDISLKCGKAALWGRILCPRETHASFQSHFSMERPPSLSDPNFATFPLTLRMEIGSTSLSLSEWEQATIGDFILLERCSYDIKNGKGTAILVAGKTPLFDIRIKEEEIKILEYAFIQEENTMSKETPFDETDPSEESSPENEEETPLWASSETEEKTTTLLSSKKIPITLTVEMGRIQMPLEKVTQLKPGNVINLHIGLEPNVYLTTNGKRIAKGELVQLGETIGVKILDLGD